MLENLRDCLCEIYHPTTRGLGERVADIERASCRCPTCWYGQADEGTPARLGGSTNVMVRLDVTLRGEVVLKAGKAIEVPIAEPSEGGHRQPMPGTTDNINHMQ